MLYSAFDMHLALRFECQSWAIVLQLIQLSWTTWQDHSETYCSRVENDLECRSSSCRLRCVRGELYLKCLNNLSPNGQRRSGLDIDLRMCGVSITPSELKYLMSWRRGDWNHIQSALSFVVNHPNTNRAAQLSPSVAHTCVVLEECIKVLDTARE